MKVTVVVGARVGRGVVLAKEPYGKKSYKVMMQCDCGNIYTAYSSGLYAGQTLSCGCWHREQVTKHGYSKEPLWAVWKTMLARCHNPKHKSYPNYGGRGISVCDRWRSSYSNFKQDMGDRPEGMTLDRIDVNGPYAPENCRWATQKQQMRNTRTNRRFSFRGELLTLGEIAELLNICQKSLASRISLYEMTLEEATSVPIGQARKYKEAK